jgi:hypothetical protein
MDLLENKVFLAGIILFTLFVMLDTCKKDGFLTGVPSYGTWDDYDNYAQLHGSSRDYWGSVAPGGGWTGHPLQPENNPGIAYMPTRDDAERPMRRIRKKRPTLVTADQQELRDLYNAQILATH